MSDLALVNQLPFELMVAICAQFRRCPCTMPDGQIFSLGCTRNHPPAAFGNTELSALRQTSRSWRVAALCQGLSQLITSNRWVRRPGKDRLLDINQRYARCARRLVFRYSDFYYNGPRRSSYGHLASEFEAVLAMGWPCLESVVVEWFSGDPKDHMWIASVVRRYAPRIREFYICDKSLLASELVPHIWWNGAPKIRPASGPKDRAGTARCGLIRRLAIKPYGYNQRWASLAPAESGAAQILRGMPNQLTTLAIGGSDFTPQLLRALQTSQMHLKSLSIEHAWMRPLAIASMQNTHLPSVTHLHLEHVLVSHDSQTLPLSADMFPNLCTLTVRHVWKDLDSGGANAQGAHANSVRGAVSLQYDYWLQTLWQGSWAELRVLALPAIADFDVEQLVCACPNLERLATNSLDYSGPRLSAAGLVAVLRGLPRLRHLSIEQRRSDGTPGYEIVDSALRRLIESVDTSAYPRSPTTCLPSSQLSSAKEMPMSKSLNTLHIPRASLTSPTLDILVMQLPNLVKLSVTLRNDAFFKPRKSISTPHQNLKWIGLSADEDILTDSLRLSEWISQKFPALRIHSTLYVH